MKTFILCSALFAMAASSSMHSGISPNFAFVAQADGKLFFADPAARTWANAEIYCRQTMTMQLAEITSKAQADALFAAFNSTIFTGNFWVSARDSGQLNQTVWERSVVSPDDNFLKFEAVRTPLTCLYFISAAEGASRTRLGSCASTLGALCEFAPPSEKKWID